MIMSAKTICIKSCLYRYNLAFNFFGLRCAPKAWIFTIICLNKKFTKMYFHKTPPQKKMSRKPLENQICEVIYTDEYIASMVFN